MQFCPLTACIIQNFSLIPKCFRLKKKKLITMATNTVRDALRGWGRGHKTRCFTPNQFQASSFSSDAKITRSSETACRWTINQTSLNTVLLHRCRPHVPRSYCTTLWYKICFFIKSTRRFCFVFLLLHVTTFISHKRQLTVLFSSPSGPLQLRVMKSKPP